MRGLKAGLGGAAILLALGACNQTEPAGEPPEPMAEETAAPAGEDSEAVVDSVVVVREDKNGGAVELAVGQTLSVELVSIPTAGYVWMLKHQPDFLEFAGESQRPTNPEYQNQPGYTGGNHWIVTNLKAVAPGTGTIRLEEGRPWESEEPPTDVFELTVTVVAAE